MKLKDADKLIELIDDDIASLDFMNMAMSRESYDVCLCTLKMVKQYIKALPIVEAKHGWWKNVHISLVDPDGVARYGRWEYECSICGTETAHITPYCPNCGARMDGGENERVD